MIAFPKAKLTGYPLKASRPNHLNLCNINEFLPGGQNNNFCPVWCNSDLNPGVAIFSQLSGEKFVQFGFEDAISNKLKFKK